jgi:hypothetical protein
MYKNRPQELMLDQANITQALDDCLLSEEDVLPGKAYWKTLPPPFPTWEQNA